MKKSMNHKNHTIAQELRELTAHPAISSKKTFGQKAADALTKWAGSWAFILIFVIIMVAWIFINGYYLTRYASGKPFDPFPFILLNLALSCLAAIQAPIILMSQNREAQKDRIRAEYDYAVNRKAEREINEIKEQLFRIEKKITRK